VRRTLIYIEQSIKAALGSFVFAANASLSRSTVAAGISGFLADLWQRDGLIGNKPCDAFTVSVGLGATMTTQHVLDCYMIVAVTLRLIHPAEFIELTFTQTMDS
jgi:phage tail sheath protein FI